MEKNVHLISTHIIFWHYCGTPIHDPSHPSIQKIQIHQKQLYLLIYLCKNSNFDKHSNVFHTC